MTEEKFIDDSQTVLKFIQYYCDNKHDQEFRTKETIQLFYKDNDLDESVTYELCQECLGALNYSYSRLQECPREEKPKCRKCDEPCYDKNEWKLLAKIMKYSGMRFGALKIKRLFTRDKSV